MFFVLYEVTWLVAGSPGRLIGEAGAKDVMENAHNVSSVDVIRIADFINNVVATRRWEQN